MNWLHSAKKNCSENSCWKSSCWGRVLNRTRSWLLCLIWRQNITLNCNQIHDWWNATVRSSFRSYVVIVFCNNIRWSTWEKNPNWCVVWFIKSCISQMTRFMNHSDFSNSLGIKVFHLFQRLPCIQNSRKNFWSRMLFRYRTINRLSRRFYLSCDANSHTRTKRRHFTFLNRPRRDRICLLYFEWKSKVIWRWPSWTNHTTCLLSFA